MAGKFIERKDSAKPVFAVGILLNKKPTAGDVGLEIEVEGENLIHVEEGCKLKSGSPWVWHKDHSLRGKENAEYVLAKPLPFKDVPKAVNDLFKDLDKNGAMFDDSNRSSVHVHLNCQDFHLNRLTAFLAMWYALEEALTAWCGEARVGNMFCLRAVDAPALISHFRNFIKSDGEIPFNEQLHYGGLNPQALNKYGSIEIRTLRGCSNAQTILDWVAILQRLHELSKEFPDPRDAVALFSSGGPLSYFESILGNYAPVVRKGINWTDAQLSKSMFRGIRFAQDLVYCRDWNAFNPVELKKDPFGRDSRKLVKKLVAEAATGPVAPSVSAQIGVPIYDDPSLQPISFNHTMLQAEEEALSTEFWQVD